MINKARLIAHWIDKSLKIPAVMGLLLSVIIASPAVAQPKVSPEATARLFESIAENNLQAVKINTLGGADLAAVNQRGMTPIDAAISSGHFEIVYYLLAYRDALKKEAVPGQRPPIKRQAPTPPAVPAVTGIHTPPPESPSWSATVITPAPPTMAPSSPGPFDPNGRAPGSGLKIIGNIRGPALPDAGVKVAPETGPAPARQATVIAAAARVAPPSAANPLFDDRNDTAAAKTGPAADATHIGEPTPPLRPTEGGRANPGKRKDEKGFVDKINSAFSSGNDAPQTNQPPRSRIVMDIPKPHQPDQGPEMDNGWTVRKVELAAIGAYPGHPASQSAKPSVPPLDGTPLSFANDLVLGLPSPALNSAPFKDSCIAKKSGAVAFCIVGLRWPADISRLFAASTILYDGTKSIVRYDEGRATFYQTLFPTTSFAAIVAHFTRRYGLPTRMIERSIAPLASPRIANPTVIWDSLAPKTRVRETLEIRTFDDTKGGFPDTRRGVALLYDKWSRPIFPDVSTIELMMLSAQEHR